MLGQHPCDIIINKLGISNTSPGCWNDVWTLLTVLKAASPAVYRPEIGTPVCDVYDRLSSVGITADTVPAQRLERLLNDVRERLR